MQRKSYVLPFPEHVPIPSGISLRWRKLCPGTAPVVGSDRTGDELGEVELFIDSGNGPMMQYDSGHSCLQQVEARLQTQTLLWPHWQPWIVRLWRIA